LRRVHVVLSLPALLGGGKQAFDSRSPRESRHFVGQGSVYER
jgi:hypothetical protein